MQEVPVTTTPLPLDRERQEVLDAVLAKLRPERMRDLLADLIDIHSPTGAEREASEFMTRHLRDVVGIDLREHGQRQGSDRWEWRRRSPAAVFAYRHAYPA